MKAKQKAEELVSKYYTLIDFSEVYQGSIKSAKQCALISVNEIMESFNSLEYYPEDLRDYWREVKQEINKI